MNHHINIHPLQLQLPPGTEQTCSDCPFRQYTSLGNVTNPVTSHYLVPSHHLMPLHHLVPSHHLVPIHVRLHVLFCGYGNTIISRLRSVMNFIGCLSTEGLNSRRVPWCTKYYKCLHGVAPEYLSELMVTVATDVGRRHLRSAAHGDLIIPASRTNNVAMDLHDSSMSCREFCSKLKKYLYPSNLKTFELAPS